MNRKLLALLATSLLVLSLVLAACAQPTATPTPEQPAATEIPETPEPPAVTEMPTPTQAPAEETPPPKVPIATYDGRSLSVPDCDYGGYIKSIEATDDYTVTFTLCKPDPAFEVKLAFGVFSIYPKEWIEATTGPTTRTSEGLEKPVGTGPYILQEWRRGESVVLVKNPNYWNQELIKNAPETLVFRWSTESAARLLELQAGTIDGFDNVGPEDFEVVKNDPNLQLVIRPALNVFYIGMTNTYPPFDNIKVRQAIAMGIDRQRIVDTFYPPGSEVASHFTPCAIPNGCAGEPWYEFNPEAARALLAEAGYPNGFKTKLYYRDVVRGYLPQVANVAQDIQAQLKENLNIEAEIVVMESGAFLEASASGKLDGFHLLGWTGDYPHITNFLDYHFGKETQQFGKIPPEIYEPLIEGGQIADVEKAAPVYERANNAIREFVPMVPVAHGASAAAYRADVVNPQASPLGNERFVFSKGGDRDTFIFMQNAEPISLFCADETDGETLRVCEQITEALFAFKINSTELEPALAESCEPNANLTQWVCTLRRGVKFHDGSDFTAEDVVATFNMGLNPGSPTHVGNTNLWEYYDYLWGLMWK
ncbi:MAG: ABC transporter substrate-binding protein [Anaerolineales bacterium]|nr:ABC transporter substrate-binding protein [Anaerolineales bacterium]MCS7246950.1 ABC transporter substrate-binding protein [Anaerolineales bacterium]MDW8160761.1 ABC transporter substrate-binding protein [Anaerolineales bacterium]MDW8447684.1 ABC transporter substrate-binding protein [Anaerolineales bacterium]